MGFQIHYDSVTNREGLSRTGKAPQVWLPVGQRVGWISYPDGMDLGLVIHQTERLTRNRIRHRIVVNGSPSRWYVGHASYNPLAMWSGAGQPDLSVRFSGLLATDLEYIVKTVHLRWANPHPATKTIIPIPDGIGLERVVIVSTNRAFVPISVEPYQHSI